MGHNGEDSGIVDRTIKFKRSLFGQAEQAFALIREIERIGGFFHVTKFARLLCWLTQFMVAGLRVVGHWMEGMTEDLPDPMRVHYIFRVDALDQGRTFQGSSRCFKLPQP